jgi:broad specificity phosphatase PhoE
MRKLRLVYISILYLLLCKDKKWKVPKERDPSSFFPKELGGSSSSDANPNNHYREKTVILIRHGESTWNDTFNAGDRNKLVFVLLFLPNLIYAILAELYFFLSGKDSESWFYDSALSVKGVAQAEGLRQFLKKEKMKSGNSLSSNNTNREEHAIKLLLALGEETSSSSHVVSSNLRRAISTAAITLADRFATAVSSSSKKSKDEIILLPSLQEISFNPDALSILPPRGRVHPTWCDNDIFGVSSSDKFSSLVNTKYHTGNKTLDSNGLLRLQQFVTDIFDDTKLPKSNIIAVGHSLFFRSFFRVFLPRETEHVSKEKKLVNGGSVMVTLREVTMLDGEKTKKEYMIDPKSIVVIYGGFGKHTKG